MHLRETNLFRERYGIDAPVRINNIEDVLRWETIHEQRRFTQRILLHHAITYGVALIPYIYATTSSIIMFLVEMTRPREVYLSYLQRSVTGLYIVASLISIAYAANLLVKRYREKSCLKNSKP